MADYLASLRRLENVLKNSLDNSAISMSELTEQLTAAASNNSDLAGDIEIALRSLLVAMISEMDPKHGFTEESPAIKLIKLAIDYSLSIDSSSSLPKVPFLLIEDLLESQTIQKAKPIWRIVESWTDQLTNDVLFSKGARRHRL